MIFGITDGIMTHDDIIALTQTAESRTLEFKETTGQLERGMETLCAFLNADGGTVLFGVTDKGEIKGQEISDKTRRDLVEAIRRIEPLALVHVSYIPIPDTPKQVVALHVEAGQLARPFMYKGRPYQRMESVTSIMPQETYHQLLMQRGGRYGWEVAVNPDLHISDLDENAIMGAVRAGIRSGRLPEITIREELPVVLEKFDLLHDGKLNNAAAVLFGRKFYNYPQCLLRLARFKGTTKEEFFDNQRAQGNIYELLDAAMAFCFKHLSLSAKVEGLYREEELSIPYKALRECCINAFCHRTYAHPGSSVGIAIYDDRVEIENTGSFPADLPLAELLREHRSKPRNPIIANVLYKSDVLENWGRGISLMVNECRRVGIPDPEFHSDGEFVWVVFRYIRHMAGQASDNPTSTPQVPHKHPTSTPQVIRLIASVGDASRSVKEMMDILQLKDRKNFLVAYLNPAIEAGVLEAVYPDQPNHPKQKYRLTEKGRTLLK